MIMIRFLKKKIILKQCHHTYFQSFWTHFVQTFSDILALYIVSMKYYDNEYLTFSLSLKICLKLSKGIYKDLLLNANILNVLTGFFLVYFIYYYDWNNLELNGKFTHVRLEYHPNNWTWSSPVWFLWWFRRLGILEQGNCYEVFPIMCMCMWQSLLIWFSVLSWKWTQTGNDLVSLFSL